MNWLDILLVIVLAVVTVGGLRTGLIKAVLSLAGVVIGTVLAGRYYTALGERLTSLLSPGVANIAAFAIILIGIMVAAWVLARLLSSVVSATFLMDWLNRLGGAAFGLVLGGVFCGAILAISLRFLGPMGVMVHSKIATFLLDNLPLVLALLPKDFDSIRPFFQ